MNQNKQERFEDAVIGIIFRNPGEISKFSIEERYFRKWHDVIVATKQLAAKGTDIDIFSVHEHMGGNGVMQALNAVRQDSVGVLSNLQKYLDGLRDIWRSEQMKMALTSSITELNNGGDLDAIISELMQSTLKAATSETKTYNHDIKNALQMFVDKLETVFDAKETGGLGLSTGLVDLDKVLGGLHPSDMVVVGARPGVGKTSFGVSVMLAMAKQGKKVAMISSEMSVEQVMLRVTSHETGISGTKLRDADLGESGWPQITAMTHRLLSMNIRIFDKPSVTIADVMMQCKAWMIDGGVDFVVIDYLTRVKPIKSSGNQVLDVGDVVTGIKNIARSLNIPVMVLAQLNRDAANRRPVMSDLRDSGIIEQEADQILMLYRDHENQMAPSEIIVEKNRHGESKVAIPCYFEKHTMRWASLAHNNQDVGDL